MRDTGWNIWNWFAFFSSLIWFRTFGKHWTTTSHSSRDSKRKKWVYPHSVTQYNGQGQSQMNQWNHEGTAGKGVAGVSQRFWNWTIFWDKSLKNNLKRRGVHLNHAQKDPEKNGKIVKQALLHQMNSFTVLFLPEILSRCIHMVERNRNWSYWNLTGSYWNIALDDCHVTIHSARHKSSIQNVNQTHTDFAQTRYSCVV